MVQAIRECVCGCCQGPAGSPHRPLTSSQHRGPLGGNITLAGCFLLSTGKQSLLLLLLRLGPVLVSQLEELCGCKWRGRESGGAAWGSPLMPSLLPFSGRTSLAVQRLRELVDGRGHLESLVQDGTLALQADVAWPFNEPGQVPLGLDVLSWKGGRDKE